MSHGAEVRPGGPARRVYEIGHDEEGGAAEKRRQVATGPEDGLGDLIRRRPARMAAGPLP